MTPDASTWRSSAEYDHLDALTASDLAWEWLRRNEAYDADFETLERVWFRLKHIRRGEGSLRTRWG